MRQAHGRQPESWQTALESFLSRKRITEKTRQKYRWNYTRFFHDLEDADLETVPSRIGEKEIVYLIDVAWKGLEDSTKKWYAKIFSMFLRYFHNDVFEKMELVFPQDARVNVDWLDAMEMIELLDAPMTPMQSLAINLELCLCLRRVECIRLRLEDVHDGYITVHGKSGKWRTVPFHSETRSLIADWMVERNRLIAEAQKYRPNIAIPETLFIWKKYKKKPQLGGYSENGDAFDDAVKISVKALTGIDFANHTLRRTGGRMMWKSGKVPIETISKIYGHSSTTITESYIGINLDDMDQAMDAFSEFQNLLRNKKNGGKING